MERMKTISILGILLGSVMTTYAQTNIGISTTGSFMHGVADKTKWGDFELVLKMQKTAFTEQEPIHVVLVFRNTGDKIITLDGILPMRQSANPPTVDVVTPDGGRLRSYGDGVPNGLMTNGPIVLNPGKEVILIDADLRSLTGSVHPPGKDGKQGAFREKFVRGKYQITGRFDPTPQIYWSKTEPLEFEIR